MDQGGAVRTRTDTGAIQNRRERSVPPVFQYMRPPSPAVPRRLSRKIIAEGFYGNDY